MEFRTRIKIQTENDTVFAARAVHVGFVVDKMVLGQVSLRALRFYPVSTIPAMLHIHSCVICGLENRPVIARSSIET
jgi:hypothetical protein